MQYLVTGAGGFIGGHLMDYLQGGSNVVKGLARAPSNSDEEQGEQILTGDICDPVRVREILGETCPDVIFHCAAQSYPQAAWSAPRDTFATNALGTLNLLQSVIDLKLSPKIIICSSSAVYGPGNGKDPIDENQALDPTDPYGLSKRTQEEIGQYYGQNHSLDIILVRPFFIVGPRKVGDVCSDFAREIVAIERGEKNSMSVGNLEVFRDFLDIQDALDAFHLLSEHGSKGTAYNICSGEASSIKVVLDTLIENSAATNIVVNSKQANMRKNDLAYRVGACDRLKSLGWSANTPLETSLSQILQYWREQ